MVKAIIFDYYGVLDPDGTGVLDQDLLDYILELRRHYKIGLLTNMSAGSLSRLVPTATSARYFDAIAISGDIGCAKPEIRAYEIVAAMLGVSTEVCVMVDDRELCCTGAAEAGMQAVRYISLADTRAQLREILLSKRNGHGLFGQ